MPPNELQKKPHKELLKLIDASRDRIIDNDVYLDLCEEYEVDPGVIYLIPMCFSDLEVSARTEHGVIYFNYKLLDDNDFSNDDHYMIHELTHVFQQCFGDGPTHSEPGEHYLDNEFEQEGFQNQTKYISDIKGDDEAEEYVDKVLDHHEIPQKERKKRFKELMGKFDED